MNIYWKIGSYLIVIIFSLATGYKIESWHADKTISAMKLDQEKALAAASAKANKDQTAIADSIASAAQSLIDTQTSLNALSQTMKKDYANARKKPLPAGCIIDDGRLRVLQNAASTANAALATP